MPQREIVDRLKKRCAVCGMRMRVILYRGGAYRGGHYFGMWPLHRKHEMEKALKVGTRKVRFGDSWYSVLKEDTKPYAHAEYWECPKCYWQK